MAVEKKAKTKIKVKKAATKAKKTTTKRAASSAVAKKRTSAAKRPAAPKLESPPELPQEPKLTAEEIQQFHGLLLEKRRELVGDVGSMRGKSGSTNRQESTGDLSNMPSHMADLGTDNYEQEFTLGLIESERQMLRDIDSALTKIEEGTYGICEATGRVINRARLQAKPEARYCIEYARKLEKGLVKPGGHDAELDSEDRSEKSA